MVTFLSSTAFSSVKHPARNFDLPPSTSRFSRWNGISSAAAWIFISLVFAGTEPLMKFGPKSGAHQFEPEVCFELLGSALLRLAEEEDDEEKHWIGIVRKQRNVAAIAEEKAEASGGSKNIKYEMKIFERLTKVGKWIRCKRGNDAKINRNRRDPAIPGELGYPKRQTRGGRANSGDIFVMERGRNFRSAAITFQIQPLERNLLRRRLISHSRPLRELNVNEVRTEKRAPIRTRICFELTGSAAPHLAEERRGRSINRNLYRNPPIVAALPRESKKARRRI
nr:hypothetical protein Iba_chr03cCG0970 [Ipomoea batatas]